MAPRMNDTQPSSIPGRSTSLWVWSLCTLNIVSIAERVRQTPVAQKHALKLLPSSVWKLINTYFFLLK